MNTKFSEYVDLTYYEFGNLENKILNSQRLNALSRRLSSNYLVFVDIHTKPTVRMCQYFSNPSIFRTSAFYVAGWSILLYFCDMEDIFLICLIFFLKIRNF